jgi:lipoprotein-releasing system permease protein
VNIDALMIHDHSMEPAKIRGIDPSIENHMGSFNDLIVEGSAEDLQSPEPRMIIGRELALQLGVAVGDTLQVLVPETQSDGQLSPRLMEWRIVGQFEAGLSETDGVWAWVNQDVLKALAPHATTELRVRLTDATLAPALRKRIEQRFGPQLNVTDWTLDNATYFRATHLEKLMMTVILSLIVAVAIFNVVAMLVMVVRSKRLDIAVIRTLGMSPQGIQRIFMWQGLLIGWGGAVLGLLMGLLLATHTAQTAAFIERLFHFQILSSEVYYITEIPSRLQWTDVGVVMALALSLALWATLSPSRRAAETLPSEVLRYDQ